MGLADWWIGSLELEGLGDLMMGWTWMVWRGWGLLNWSGIGCIVDKTTINLLLYLRLWGMEKMKTRLLSQLISNVTHSKSASLTVSIFIDQGTNIRQLYMVLYVLTI